MNPASTTNPYKGRTGLDRIVRATGYSWSGLRAAYGNESAFRQEAWLFVATLPLAVWLGRSWLEVLLLTGSVWLVLIVELLNSAVEAVVDRVSLEPNELAGRAKDYGSAAVLLTLMLTAAVWLTITWQRCFA
jgi:diacylglycerol kinase (ATP)